MSGSTCPCQSPPGRRPNNRAGRLSSDHAATRSGVAWRGRNYADQMVRGTVRFWLTDEGWGVVDSSETPGGCFAHFSFVQMVGYRSLSEGQAVELEWERPLAGDYEGYAYFAKRVVPGGSDQPE